ALPRPLPEDRRGVDHHAVFAQRPEPAREGVLPVGFLEERLKLIQQRIVVLPGTALLGDELPPEALLFVLHGLNDRPEDGAEVRGQPELGEANWLRPTRDELAVDADRELELPGRRPGRGGDRRREAGAEEAFVGPAHRIGHAADEAPAGWARVCGFDDGREFGSGG